MFSRFAERAVLDAEGLSAWLLENTTLHRMERGVFEVAKSAHGLCSDGVFRKRAIARSDPFETLLSELQTHIALR